MFFSFYFNVLLEKSYKNTEIFSIDQVSSEKFTEKEIGINTF
jgi:hypothetical protein